MNIQDISLSRLANTAIGAASYLPEPATKASGLFYDVLDSVASFGKSAIGGVGGDVFGDYKSLLEEQMRVHAEMQSMTLASNIERSKHDTKMVALRNIQS